MVRQFEYTGMFQNLDSSPAPQWQVDFIGLGHTGDPHPWQRVGDRLKIKI